MEKHGSASTRKLAPHALVNNLNNSTAQAGAKSRKTLLHDSNNSKTLDGTSGSRSLDNNRKSSITVYGAISPREYDLLNAPRKSDVISPNLKRRARRLAVDGSMDHATRRMIRYALENRDPYLVQLVTRVEAGETRIANLILEGD